MAGERSNREHEEVADEVKNVYRLESKVRLLEEGGAVSEDPDLHNVDVTKKIKKKSRRRPRLKTKMSIREFRQKAGQSYIYTVWPCLSIILVVVMATVVIVLGLTSDSEVPTILGIDATKTNEWVILLSAISFGTIFANILLSCLCFRFKVCEKLTTVCPTSSRKDTASSGDETILDEYQQHLMAAKKHLEAKRTGKANEKPSLKRVNTWSIPKITDFESEETKVLHNKVKHLREHEKNGHKHHHHGRAKRVCTMLI